MDSTTLANLFILGLNFGVLALSIKLYTEVLKDQSQNRRAKALKESAHGN